MTAILKTVMLFVPVIGIILPVLSPAARDLDPAMLETLQSWKTRINLSEEQQEKAQALMGELGTKTEALGEQFEAQGEEVDKKAAVAALKQVQGEFQSEFSSILDAEQKTEFAAIQEEVHQLVLGAIGKKRALKLQQQFELSDEQTGRVAPVLAKQTGELEAYFAKLQESADEQPRNKRRARRAKLKKAKGLKDIMDDSSDQLKEIMTDQQWDRYEAFQKQQRDELKAKAKSRQG